MHLDRRRVGHYPARRSTSRYTLRGSGTWSISSGPATSVPYPSSRPARLWSSSRFSTERSRTAEERRRSVPSTTNSFSVVTTRCVRSQRQTARRASSAPATTRTAPGTRSGQGCATRIPPTPARTSACVKGRASTTPWRRASKHTCSSGDASTLEASALRHPVLPFAEPPDGGKQPKVGKTARTAFVATLVVLGVLVLALALWKLKVVIALVFFGLIIAAAMRPG